MSPKAACLSHSITSVSFVETTLLCLFNWLTVMHIIIRRFSMLWPFILLCLTLYVTHCVFLIAGTLLRLFIWLFIGN